MEDLKVCIIGIYLDSSLIILIYGLKVHRIIIQ